jgi:hypothetical protein
VLEAAAARGGLDLALTPYPIGWKAYEESRSTLTPETVAAVRNHMGWILGPTFAGEYPNDDPIKGHPSGYLRRNFALFANVRPVQAWPQLAPLIPDLDITILRENTEGFYPDRNLAWSYGEFKPTEDVGISLRVITAPACERFARFAFDYAATANIDRLAVVHKRTALPQTEGLFIGAFERLHPEYPNIQLELVRIDTFSSAFRRHPHRYRLDATTNLFWRHPIRPGLRARRRCRHRPVTECRPRARHGAGGARHRTRHRRKGDRQPLGIDPVDGATADLVLPADPDRGLSRDRPPARSRRQKCDRRRLRDPGSRRRRLDRRICDRSDRYPRSSVGSPRCA